MEKGTSLIGFSFLHIKGFYRRKWDEETSFLRTRSKMTTFWSPYEKGQKFFVYSLTKCHQSLRNIFKKVHTSMSNNFVKGMIDMQTELFPWFALRIDHLVLSHWFVNWLVWAYYTWYHDLWSVWDTDMHESLALEFSFRLMNTRWRYLSPLPSVSCNCQLMTWHHSNF